MKLSERMYDALFDLQNGYHIEAYITMWNQEVEYTVLKNYTSRGTTRYEPLHISTFKALLKRNLIAYAYDRVGFESEIYKITRLGEQAELPEAYNKLRRW